MRCIRREKEVGQRNLLEIQAHHTCAAAHFLRYSRNDAVRRQLNNLIYWPWELHHKSRGCIFKAITNGKHPSKTIERERKRDAIDLRLVQ